MAQGDPQVPENARQAAEAMVARFVESWNQADGAAYGANYWPEAELVNPSGVISRGNTAIVQEHIGLWAGIFKGSHVAAKVRRIRMLGSDFMMVDSMLPASCTITSSTSWSAARGYLILSIRCYCMRVPTVDRRASESRPPLSA